MPLPGNGYEMKTSWFWTLIPQNTDGTEVEVVSKTTSGEAAYSITTCSHKMWKHIRVRLNLWRSVRDNRSQLKHVSFIHLLWEPSNVPIVWGVRRQMAACFPVVISTIWVNNYNWMFCYYFQIICVYCSGQFYLKGQLENNAKVNQRADERLLNVPGSEHRLTR